MEQIIDYARVADILDPFPEFGVLFRHFPKREEGFGASCPPALKSSGSRQDALDRA